MINKDPIQSRHRAILDLEHKVNGIAILSMPRRSIIGHGVDEIEHPFYKDNPGHNWLNVNDQGMIPVKWVAVRGDMDDWAIYHSLDHRICGVHSVDLDCDNHLKADLDMICNSGFKLKDILTIKKFMNCDASALKLYRS